MVNPKRKKKEEGAVDSSKRLISTSTMNLFSKIVDFFTILISFIDVVSDIIVAKQFYDGGHMGWFWAVAASLLLSNVAYAFYCVSAYDFNSCMVKLYFDHKQNWVKKYWLFWMKDDAAKRYDSAPKKVMLLQFCLIFPVAQLCPTVVWYLHGRLEKAEEEKKKREGSTTKKSYLPREVSQDSSDFSRTNSTGEDNETSYSKPTMAEQELDSILGDADLLTNMGKSFQNHVNSHALFYMETVVESLPQSVIQLMAVTMLGEATGMQLFSMSLSLVSIVSKAYLISQSSDLKVFVFKFLLAAHDVFSLFYASGSVLSADQEKHTALKIDLGPLYYHETDIEVSWISAQWFSLLQKKVLGILIFYIAGMCLVAVYNTKEHNQTLNQTLRAALMLLGAGAILLVPIVFLGEGLKLSWFIFFLFLLEPSESAKFPMALALRTFIRNGKDESEIESRARYVFTRSCEEKYKRLMMENTKYYYYFRLHEFKKLWRMVLRRENDWALKRIATEERTTGTRTKSLGQLIDSPEGRAIQAKGNSLSWFDALVTPEEEAVNADLKWKGIRTVSEFNEQKSVWGRLLGSDQDDPVERELSERKRQLRNQWRKEKFDGLGGLNGLNSWTYKRVLQGRGNVIDEMGFLFEEDFLQEESSKKSIPIDPERDRPKQDATSIDLNCSETDRGQHQFKLLDCFWHIYVDFGEIFREIKKDRTGGWAKTVPKYIIFCLFSAVVTQVLGAIYSLLFPFINTLLYPSNQNSFQTFCMTASLVSLVGIATLVPHVLQFAYYSAVIVHIHGDWNTKKDVFWSWINDYHKPSNAAILEALVPSDLMNHDLKTKVATLLGEGDDALQKTNVSLRECQLLKRGGSIRSRQQQ